MLQDTNLTDAEHDELLLQFFYDLGRLPVKVVWTMHNARPHAWDPARADRLYQALAAIADGVIHHSEWGMQEMRARLHYRPETLHTVIPHGHYGKVMFCHETRSQLEEAYGLPPCKIRYGLLGRPDRKKQVHFVIEAFMRSARNDIQLLTDAWPATEPQPNDPRIIVLPRNRWLARKEVSRRAHLCDAMVCAHDTAHYLTSGIVADAVGLGIPLLAPRWAFFEEILGDAAFYHNNTPQNLAELLDRLQPDDIEAGSASVVRLQTKCEWTAIRCKTKAFYDQLGIVKQ
jgi:hypothetical protein